MTSLGQCNCPFRNLKWDKLNKLAIVHGVGRKWGRNSLGVDITSSVQENKAQLGGRVGYRIEGEVRRGRGASILPGFPFSVPRGPSCALVLTIGFHEILLRIFLNWVDLPRIEAWGALLPLWFIMSLSYIISYPLCIVFLSPFKLWAFWGQCSIYFREG